MSLKKQSSVYTLDAAIEILQQQRYAAVNDPEWPLASDHEELAAAKSFIDGVELLFSEGSTKGGDKESP